MLGISRRVLVVEESDIMLSNSYGRHWKPGLYTCRAAQGAEEAWQR